MTKKKRRVAAVRGRSQKRLAVKSKSKSKKPLPKSARRSRPIAKSRRVTKPRPKRVLKPQRSKAKRARAKPRLLPSPPPRPKRVPKPAPAPPRRRVIRPGVPFDRPYPAPWVLDIQDLSTRRLRINQLRQDVQELRKIFRGFEARQGFDVRHPENWSAARVAKARRYGLRMRQLKSTPHVIARPRTQAQRDALMKHVAQPWPNQKAFIVHTPHPINTVVDYVLEPAVSIPVYAAALTFVRQRPAQLRVQLVKQIHGGESLTQDFLFREILGYQPGLVGPGGTYRVGQNPWEDMVRATRALLPFMPKTTMSARTGEQEEAWYTFISMPHDSIGAAIRYSEIVNSLQFDFSRYSDSFAGLILGFRYQGDRWKAAMSPQSEMNQRDKTRALYKKIREEDIKAMRRMDERFKRKPKKKIARHKK